MSVLTLSNVGQSFGAFDLFTGASGSVPAQGKVGLVGPNGVGKTTLLLILAGLAQPSSGRVQLARGTRIGYQSQESSDAFIGRDHNVFEEMLTVFKPLMERANRLRKLEARMSKGQESDELFERYSEELELFEAAGGYDFEVRIRQVLTGLGFTEATWAQPLAQLSGGQKTRALLARLLLEEPDLLILDEPTNHLDLEATAWLEGMLNNWQGALLIVSHDRYFLDKVANTIWEMTPSGIESYRGNYSAYVLQRDERWQRKLKEYDTLMERLYKELDYIQRNMAGQRTQMAQGKLSRLAREVEAIHAGGLGVLGQLKAKGWLRVQQEIGLAMRPAATVGELKQRIDAIQRPVQPHTLKVRLEASHRSGDIVLRTKDLRIGYPQTPLFESDDLDLRRLQCAALIGPNGSGKTTFLRSIIEEIPPLSGEIKLGANVTAGYFAQAHAELDPHKSVFDELIAHQPMLTSQARSYLARFLFRGDDVFNKVSTLSGGERGRLALALLALNKANFLILDEPTNHLDIPAQESLQESLQEFQGTVLLVSHDRYLIDRLASQIWELEGGFLHVHAGSYRSYMASKEAEQTVVPEEKVPEQRPEPEISGNGQNGLSKNELRRQRQRLQELEASIHESEKALERLTAELQAATSEGDASVIRETSEAYQRKATALAHLIAQWEEVAHVA